MTANNTFAYTLIDRGLRYLIHKIIDIVQADQFMEATCCNDLLQKILEFHDLQIAEESQISGQSLVHFYFNDIICDQTCSHSDFLDYSTPCQNCRCEFCPPLLLRTFFFDYTTSPPDLVDIENSVTNGIPNWFLTGPIPLKYLSWFKVLNLMQGYWNSHMSTRRYHMQDVIILWGQLFSYFNTSYPIDMTRFDPLLLLPSLNEPALKMSSWDFVRSFSMSSLVGSGEPFSSGAKMWAYLSYLVIFNKFPRSMDTDNLLWELSYILDLPWFDNLCKEYCEALNLTE